MIFFMQCITLNEEKRIKIVLGYTSKTVPTLGFPNSRPPKQNLPFLTSPKIILLNLSLHRLSYFKALNQNLLTFFKHFFD